jgi:excinuclease ABC subunit C
MSVVRAVGSKTPGFDFCAKRYPQEPGCYLMKDRRGLVFYVGKAKNLRRRLASYFRPGSRYWRARRVARRVADIEVLIVNNELESLVLENNLIKLYKPAYNLRLVPEDSGYHYIVLTNEELPRLLPYRRNRYNKSLDGVDEAIIVRRFGPYINYQYRNALLEYVNETYGLRTCVRPDGKVCLRYHIHRCSGPCQFSGAREAYGEAVKGATTFLSRPQGEVLARMRLGMFECADRLEFERAAHIKAQLCALEETLRHQIVEREADYDQGVVYFGERGTLAMRVRRGAVLGMELLPVADADPTDVLVPWCGDELPDELIVNALSEPDRLSEAFLRAYGHPVRLRVAPGGIGHELLALCEKNYAYRAGLDTS